jgi:exodeoxyribonuclease V
VAFLSTKQISGRQPQTDTITWSRQQTAALAAVRSWQQDRTSPFFYLAGYAGTGKSTLAAEIAYRTDGDVVFAAFTGKAAAVMRQKDCANATTIDSLIYRAELRNACVDDPPCSYPPCRERCRFFRRHFVGRKLNPDSPVAAAKLCVVDEVSMVSEQMGLDLLSFGTPVLVLGDVAQLPPIGGGGFFTKNEPDFQLTEVHRQAFGSPIIKLATRAREGLPLVRGRYGDSMVVRDVSSFEMRRYDQVICGTHQTRHRLNEQIRRRLGYGGPKPEPGEKVICLKNDSWRGLRNGTLWTVVEATPDNSGFIDMTVEDEDGYAVEVVAPEQGFTSWDGDGSDLPKQPFAFGYAITCHKAQGSQWDSVLIVDESRVFRQHRWCWLYTGTTRAVERVTVVERC